ncbi:MAG: PAS domain S-box protein [Byssovorax sp.]
MNENESLLDAILLAATEGILVQDTRGTVIACNVSAQQILGRTRAEMNTTRAAEPDAVREDGRPFLRSELPAETTLRTGERCAGVVMGIHTPAGERRWIAVRSEPVRAAPGGPLTAVVTTFTDLTEQRRAEAELRESEQQHRTVVDSIQESVFVVRGRKKLFYNDHVLRLLGMTAEEYDSLPLLHNVYPEDRASLLDQLEAVQSGAASSLAAEFRVRTRAGKQRWVRGRGTRVIWAGEPAVVFFAEDITERREAEEQRERLKAALVEAQKLEAVGTLAGGVAHEFNNILAGIMTGLSLIEIEVGVRPELKADLDDMKGLVRRGADLSRQLLGFARRGRYDPRPLDLTAAVTETSSMFGRTRRELSIETILPPGLPPVLMDRAQLDQVLLNLLVNASHAMPSGGRIRLAAELATLSATEAALRGTSPGRFVMLHVSDTGTGMDEATRARVFEPFFSTKALGRGAGLGLAAVYGIITGHKGAIAVESAPGEGTTFTLWLPVAEEPSKPHAPPAPASAVTRGLVLVVDDEETLLGFAARSLRALGYEALTAASGKEAVAIAREQGDRIALVILDLVMPEMNGSKTFAALREIAPDLKVLLASGYAIDEHAQALLDRGCVGFLSKPFDLKTLDETLRSLV